MSDAIAAIFSLIMWLFGIAEEAKITREECEALQSSGVSVYPLTQEQFERIEKCKELEK